MVDLRTKGRPGVFRATPSYRYREIATPVACAGQKFTRPPQSGLADGRHTAPKIFSRKYFEQIPLSDIKDSIETLFWGEQQAVVTFVAAACIFSGGKASRIASVGARERFRSPCGREIGQISRHA
jgi:hypothetical protein